MCLSFNVNQIVLID